MDRAKDSIAGLSGELDGNTFRDIVRVSKNKEPLAIWREVNQKPGADTVILIGGRTKRLSGYGKE